MTNPIFFILIVCTILCCCSTRQLFSNICESQYENVESHLASKTPYRFLKHQIKLKLNSSGCDVLGLWGMVRHGTRNPGSKVMKQMKSRLQLLRDEIVHNTINHDYGDVCQSEFDSLNNWLPQVEESKDKHLVSQGEEEMFDLARRYQSYFPTLFTKTFTNSTYKFQYTDTQRTAASANAFCSGLFNESSNHPCWFPLPKKRDPILRFYKLCERWRTTVKKNPDSIAEKEKFSKGPEIQAVVRNLSSRLGLNYTLSLDDIHLMYMTCAFETAWNSESISPWCTVFLETDLEVLEYLEDLKHYYIDGYGYKITRQSACPAFRDMIYHFKSLMTGEGPKVVVYFTHSGAILKFLSHLGLYMDPQPLLHNNFHSYAHHRLWKVGKIDCFGSNIAFVLFRCDNEFKVLTLHQEEVVILPLCPPLELCPFKKLEENYYNSIYSCNFDDICKT